MLRFASIQNKQSAPATLADASQYIWSRTCAMHWSTTNASKPATVFLPCARAADSPWSPNAATAASITGRIAAGEPAITGGSPKPDGIANGRADFRPVGRSSSMLPPTASGTSPTSGPVTVWCSNSSTPTCGPTNGPRARPSIRTGSGWLTAPASSAMRRALLQVGKCCGPRPGGEFTRSPSRESAFRRTGSIAGLPPFSISRVRNPLRRMPRPSSVIFGGFCQGGRTATASLWRSAGEVSCGPRTRVRRYWTRHRSSASFRHDSGRHAWRRCRRPAGSHPENDGSAGACGEGRGHGGGSDDLRSRARNMTGEGEEEIPLAEQPGR
jgi:hypothetical protein